MNAIRYFWQEFWFWLMEWGQRWKEEPFLAPDFIPVSDFRNTQWLQVCIPMESKWDEGVEKLILGLAGMVLVYHLLTNGAQLPEEFREFARVALSLF